MGLEGDEQADRSVHGGLKKAVYAYPSEHYGYWRDQAAQAGGDSALPYGTLGENLTLSGLLETEVFVGELHGSMYLFDRRGQYVDQLQPTVNGHRLGYIEDGKNTI